MFVRKCSESHGDLASCQQRLDTCSQGKDLQQTKDMDILSIDIWPLAVWRCVKSKDRRGDKSSWKCFNLSEPLFLIVRWFRLQSQILFSALDIWSTAAKCALRSFALLFPSDLTQFTSHSAIREINNILTLHCCIYSPLPAGT